MQMKTHFVSQEELMAYLDGELSAHEATNVAAHVTHCSECQALAADFKSVSRRLAEWQFEESNLAAPQIFDSTEPGPVRPKRTSLSQRRWTWAVASLAVFCMLAVVLPVIRTLQPPRVATLSDSKQFTPEYGSRSSGILAGAAGSSGEAAAPAPPPTPQPAPPTGPLIVRTAELSLTTREFNKSRRAIERILASYRGYVAHLSVTSPPDRGRSLDATLKVPAAQLDNLISALKQLGRVDTESQGGQEVTQQAVDLEARLSNARTTEQRLTELLRDRTGKLSDVLAVEEQTDIVRGQIEQMQAEQESLSHQIAFASLDLKLAEEYEEPLATHDASISTRLRNAAVDGFERVISGLIDLLTFLLAYGPGLLIAAVILFFPVRALWKRRSRVTTA